MNDKLLILAIDDDENVLKLVKANLSLEGFNVITAPNGYDGLRLFEENSPALVLLDIMMPGMDGLMAIKLIREQSKTPIIILTAKDDMKTLEEALSLGADDFLTKPFSLRELNARVQSKIRRYRG